LGHHRRLSQGEQKHARAQVDALRHPGQRRKQGDGFRVRDVEEDVIAEEKRIEAERFYGAGGVLVKSGRWQACFPQADQDASPKWTHYLHLRAPCGAGGRPCISSIDTVWPLNSCGRESRSSVDCTTSSTRRASERIGPP